MKRILLSIILFSTINHFAFSQDSKMVADWLFVYYMPYDNNLSTYGEPIIQMIKDSMRTEKVIVTVQADFSDTLGMRRLVITHDSIIRYTIKNEYSALTETYKEYLKWVLNSIEYKKIAIVFLDHGGKLDELCLDENPKTGFLKVDSLKSVFSHQVGSNKIDLLFLQVCTKGSIEPIFEFKDVAKYTLCSQIELGAPNYYYHGLFAELSNRPEMEGDEVAKIIVANEADNMYNSYTIINNNKLDSLQVLIQMFSNQISNTPPIKLLQTPTYSYYCGERYWDMISFFENIDLEDYPSLHLQKNEIVDFILKDVILFHQTNPKNHFMNKFSGLSMSCYTNEKEYNNLFFYKLLKTLRQLENEK